jgi:hypothetical protein
MELGVDTYVTADEASEYFSKRANSGEWMALTDLERDSFLQSATLIIEEQAFIGSRRAPEQPLKFPRNGVAYDSFAESSVDLSLVDYPRLLKWAVMEQAFSMLAGATEQLGEVSLAGVLTISAVRGSSRASIHALKLLDGFIKVGNSWQVGVAW